MLPRNIICVWGQRSSMCDIICRRTNNKIFIGSHNLIFWHLWSRPDLCQPEKLFFFRSSSFRLHCRDCCWAAGFYFHHIGCCSRHTSSSFPLLKIRSSEVEVQSLFVFGALTPSHLSRVLQTSGRALAMFLLYKVSHSGSLTSLFTST